jgi:hypothetical protein
MQKRLLHLLLLLLALTFGPAANALAAPGHQPASGSQLDSLHLTQRKPFEQAGLVELKKARSRARAAELGRKWTILRLALSSGMQKRLHHHLILLLTLISGPGAAAWAANTPAIAAPSPDASTTDSLHLIDSKPFEQVGDV